MLCLALLVLSCRGASGNNSSSEALEASRRANDALAASLRRQLMRDNYDYPHPAPHQPHNKTGHKNLSQTPRTSQTAQRDSDALATDRYAPQQFRSAGQHPPPLPPRQLAPDYSDVRAVAEPDRRGDAYDAFHNKRRDTDDPPYPPDPMRPPQPSGEPDDSASDSAAPDISEPADIASAEHDASDSSDSRRRELALYDEYGAQGVRPPSTRRPPRQHRVSKQDLLYYMDDDKLRRHNRAPAAAPRTPRSVLVTVAAGNVTYKLLTLGGAGGARRGAGARHVLEERAPRGVALISLDRAPLPAFRLPAARRQYMHEPHHHA
ncbi:uncharacterized protein LOC110383293 isoform X1 [Helicoverpa armigera]|uniref:uncharacterized protein LOC110383293 isoform X1 n=2 Tax=Helicoverpa armigera TaxID=29058 RepID=UPI003083CE6D